MASSSVYSKGDRDRVKGSSKPINVVLESIWKENRVITTGKYNECSVLNVRDVETLERIHSRFVWSETLLGIRILLSTKGWNESGFRGRDEDRSRLTSWRLKEVLGARPNDVRSRSKGAVCKRKNESGSEIELYRYRTDGQRLYFV
jgi:hypothetical protein